MRLLVAPVAMDKPILLEDTDWPKAPKIPEVIFPAAQASIPRLMDPISILLQSASLIF